MSDPDLKQRLEHGEEEETAADEKEEEEATSAMEEGGAHLEHRLLHPIRISSLLPRERPKPVQFFALQTS